MPDSKSARSTGYSESQLAHVAMLYYREGLTQGDIAQRLGVSRATVLNYLKLARDLGIVDIRIRGESFTSSSLSKELSERFGLTDCYIAHTDADGQDEDQVLSRVAHLAAAALRDLLEPGDKLGVAWGETIQQVAHSFPVGPVPSLTVYQLIGSMMYDPLHPPEDCAIEIARRTLAACRTLHAPAMVSSADLAESLRAEPILAHQLRELASVDKAVFSVGSLNPPKTVIGSGLVTEEELDTYLSRGAIGVFWGHFIKADGKAVPGPLDRRAIGIELEALRQIPMRMLVASGVGKYEAVRAAIKGGLVTHLVTDEPCALWLSQNSPD